MARKQRIHFPGAFYHVYLRGNAKQDIFFNDQDRKKFCFLLEECSLKYNCRIHAFCLMNNHFHLAIQVDDIPLSKFMHNISFRYASWVNKAYQRVGHLFQSRYNAVLVDTDSYLLELIRYIHLNPVRAKLLNNPHDFWWSSHSDYLGQQDYQWVYKNLVLSQFHEGSGEQARRLYKEYINAGVNQGYDSQYTQGVTGRGILGDEKFILKITTGVSLLD